MRRKLQGLTQGFFALAQIDGHWSEKKQLGIQRSRAPRLRWRGWCLGLLSKESCHQRLSLDQWTLFLFWIDENSLGCTVEIFILATFQRPQEAAQAKRAKKESDGYEIGEGGHDDRA